MCCMLIAIILTFCQAHVKEPCYNFPLIDIMQSNGHRIHFLHAVVIRTIYGDGEWLNLHSIYKRFLEVRCQ